MAFLSALASVASKALPFIGKAASAAAPFFSKGKTSGGRTISRQPLILPEVQGFINQNLQKFDPFADFGSFEDLGQITPFEQLGLGTLGNFLQQSGVSPLFDQAQQQIASTLRGDFLNPATNPLIQALTTQSATNLRDTIDAARARRGGRGTFFTKEGIEEEGRLAQGALENLNVIIGNILNQERARQFQAAPIAADLDKFRQFDIPLAQVGASQQFGGLQRTLDTAELEAQYQDFLRKQQSGQGVVNLAGGVQGQGDFGFKNFTTPITQQPSTIGNILNTIDLINRNFGGTIGSIFNRGAQRPSSGFSFQPV